MRVLTMLVMLLLSAPAAAEWVKFTETDTATHYFDPATVKVDDNLRRVRMLQDLKQRNDLGITSMRALMEYDCKQGLSRLLSFSAHSERMAGGDTKMSADMPQKWNNIPPDTPDATLIKLVCADR